MTAIGFSGSVTNCMDHAVDGFTVWGFPILYKLQHTWDKTVIKVATTGVTVLASTEINDVYPWEGASGIGDLVGTADLAINTGQPRTGF